MSNLKRKDAPGGHPPAKSAKGTKEARPSNNDGASKPSDSGASRPKPAGVVSVLKDEEPMFPRGGGSILTPLEQKQINLEAKADAKHEEEFETSGKAGAKKKRKASQKTSKKTHTIRDDADDSVKAESLNFKVSYVGSSWLTRLELTSSRNSFAARSYLARSTASMAPISRSHSRITSLVTSRLPPCPSSSRSDYK